MRTKHNNQTTSKRVRWAASVVNRQSIAVTNASGMPEVWNYSDEEMPLASYHSVRTLFYYQLTIGLRIHNDLNELVDITFEYIHGKDTVK